MKTLNVIVIIVTVIAALIVSVYAYYGGFKKIIFKVERQGGETLVYEDMVGDYSQTPKVQDKIYRTLLNDYKIETTKGFGIYYDNPKEVEKEKLRSEIGCIVEGLDSTTIVQLSTKFKVKTLPESNYIVTEFPYKGMISVILGIMKVYPVLEKYCRESETGNGPVMEIYDIQNKTIIYRKEK